MKAPRARSRDLRLLRRLDMPAFQARCELYATWLRCRATIAKGGITYDHKKLQQQRREVRLAQDCPRQIPQDDNEFGLTRRRAPGSRI